jgi:hypothetical protein
MYDWAQADSEGTRKLHEEVAQMSWFPLSLHYLLSPTLHLWWHGKSPVMRWQKNRFWPDLQSVLHVMQAAAL